MEPEPESPEREPEELEVGEPDPVSELKEAGLGELSPSFLPFLSLLDGSLPSRVPEPFLDSVE